MAEVHALTPTSENELAAAGVDRAAVAGGRTIVLDRFGPPDVMRLEEQEVRAPGDDEVLVAVEAIGVNFADTMVRRGEYRKGQALTFTPGFEVAGRVRAAGPGAGLDPGTPVAVFTEQGGGYADYVLAPKHRVYQVPADLPSVQIAGIFLQGVTAWYAIHRYGRVQPGDWVLVYAAAGGLGGLASQLARLAGAKVIGTASTEAKLEVAVERGARSTIISSPDRIRSWVPQITDQHGADVVVDGVGGPLFAAGLDVLARGGRYVVVGASSQEPCTFDARRLMPRAHTISGFIVARVAEQSPEEPGAALLKLCKLLRDEELELPLTVMGFDDVRRAHELIEARRHTGKLVLTTNR